MTITSLTLTNFRSFVDTELNLNAPRVFVAGINGAGKSTVREAIKWALTGRCQGLDGKGAGAEKLVPSFNAQVHTVDVKLLLNDVLGVHRVWEPRGATLEVDGFAGSSTEQQKALCEDVLKVASPAYLDAALDTRSFIDLHHAEAKALVLNLLNVKVDVDGVLHTLDQLDTAYAQAFKDRKTAKSTLAGLFVPPVPTSPEPSLAKRTLADKDEHLKGVDGLLSGIRGAVGELQQQIGGTVAQRKDLNARLDKVLNTPLLNTASVPLDGLDDKIHDLEERLALMEESAREQAEEVVPQPMSSPASIDLARTKRQADTLRTFDPAKGCVLDGKVKCPVGKVVFFGRARDIEDALDKLAPAPVEAPAPVAEHPRVSLVQEVNGLIEQKRRHEQFYEAGIRHGELRAELEKEIAALPDVSVQTDDLSKLQDRIAKGEAIQKSAIAFYAALDAYKAAQDHRTAAEREVQRLEGLVDVLGPNGARVQALAKALEPFQVAVNGFLKEFGWSVTFTVDPWQVVINGRPVDTYSKSEQHRIGIALQLAIAQLSGLGFAVVDELDMMTSANRDLMGRLIFTAKLDQVIVMSSRELDVALPDTNRIPGMIGIRLGTEPNGRSVVLEAVGAAA